MMNILLLFPGFIVALIIVFCYECKIRRTEPMNKVHFYVARNKSGRLNLFLNKPSRDNTFTYWMQYDFYALGNSHHKWLSTRIVEDVYFDDLGLNPDDFKYLKWEDEPVEVFLNMED